MHRFQPVVRARLRPARSRRVRFRSVALVACRVSPRVSRLVKSRRVPLLVRVRLLLLRVYLLLLPRRRVLLILGRRFLFRLLTRPRALTRVLLLLFGRPFLVVLMEIARPPSRLSLFFLCSRRYRPVPLRPRLVRVVRRRILVRPRRVPLSRRLARTLR